MAHNPKGRKPPKWLRNFSRKAREVRPYVASGYAQPSRRIEGQFTQERENPAYKNVIICIEKGLGQYQAMLRFLVREIWNIQHGEIDEYYTHCFAFGFSEEKLKHSRSANVVRNRGMALGTGKRLIELAGKESASGQSVLPKLFPPVSRYARKGSPDSDDLIVILCRSRDRVSLSAQVQNTLDRLAPYRRVFWLYVNDGDPELETEQERRC